MAGAARSVAYNRNRAGRWRVSALRRKTTGCARRRTGHSYPTSRCLNWDETKSNKPPVPYEHSGRHIARHPGSDVLDLFSTLTSSPAMQASEHAELMHLLLADR